MRPVATNVRIKLNGVETYDVLPEVLPDLFYGAPLRMIGRYKQGGVSQVSVSGEVMGKPFEQKIDINLPKSSDDNPEIERMWAYCRVEQLMSQMRERGASPEKEAEIVRLCEGFSIASEYASFIVLENDSEYQRWSIQRRNATRVRRDDAARNRLQVQLERLREQSLADIGPSKSPSSSKPVDTLSDSSSAPIAERTRVANRPSDLFLPTTTPSAPIASDSASSAPQTRFNESSRNVQRPSGGGGGGGAIDPISCAIALGMAGASAWAAGRRRSTKSEPSETKN